MQYRLNTLLPSPPDFRDWDMGRCMAPAGGAAALPRATDYRPILRPARDQGPDGKCVGFATAALREAQEAVEYRRENEGLAVFYMLSPEFVYALRANQSTEGMWPRDAMKILRDTGIVEERYWPLNSPGRPPADVIEHAALRVTTGFARVHSVETARAALYEQGPLLLCTPVYHNETRFWHKMPERGDVLGYHATAIIGYDDDRQEFAVRNSWGARWNGDGHAAMPYADWPEITECWSCVDADTPRGEAVHVPRRRGLLARLLERIF